MRTSIIDGCGRERERRGAILLVCFCLQLILSVVFHSPHAIQRLGLWNALKELKHEAQGKHTMHVACTTHVHRSLTAPSRALYVPLSPMLPLSACARRPQSLSSRRRYHTTRRCFWCTPARASTQNMRIYSFPRPANMTHTYAPLLTPAQVPARSARQTGQHAWIQRAAVCLRATPTRIVRSESRLVRRVARDRGWMEQLCRVVAWTWIGCAIRFWIDDEQLVRLLAPEHHASADPPRRRCVPSRSRATRGMELPHAVLQRVSKPRRIPTGSRLISVLPSDVPWLNSIHVARSQLEAAMGAKALDERARQEYALGLSLAALFDITGAGDFLRALYKLIDEWESWAEQGGSSRSVMPGPLRNFFRPQRQKPRPSAAQSTATAEVTIAPVDAQSESFLVLAVMVSETRSVVADHFSPLRPTTSKSMHRRARSCATYTRSFSPWSSRPRVADAPALQTLAPTCSSTNPPLFSLALMTATARPPISSLTQRYSDR